MDNPILGFIGVFNADNFENFASKLRIPLAGLVAEVITHPQWNPTTRNADIAIVRLINDIVYTSIKYFSNFIFKEVNLENNFLILFGFLLLLYEGSQECVVPIAVVFTHHFKFTFCLSLLFR